MLYIIKYVVIDHKIIIALYYKCFIDDFLFLFFNYFIVQLLFKNYRWF